MKAIFFVVLACGWVIWMTVRYVTSQAIARRRARFDPLAQLDHITSEGQMQAWIEARQAAGWPDAMIAAALNSWAHRPENAQFMPQGDGHDHHVSQDTPPSPRV